MSTVKRVAGSVGLPTWMPSAKWISSSKMSCIFVVSPNATPSSLLSAVFSIHSLALRSMPPGVHPRYSMRVIFIPFFILSIFAG